MDIKINNKYHLTSDPKQFILHEKNNKTEELSHFTTLEGVVKSYINKNIRNNDNIKTLDQLAKSINKYAKEINNSFKDHIEIE